jgi:hypothetical protein
LRREKDQPVNQDNAALIELRSFDDVISLPIHADLLSAEQSLLPAAHVTLPTEHYFLCGYHISLNNKAILNFYKCQFQEGSDLPTSKMKCHLF